MPTNEQNLQEIIVKGGHAGIWSLLSVGYILRSKNHFTFGCESGRKPVSAANIAGGKRNV